MEHCYVGPPSTILIQYGPPHRPVTRFVTVLLGGRQPSAGFAITLPANGDRREVKPMEENHYQTFGE
jgi:hypothetical protein